MFGGIFTEFIMLLSRYRYNSRDKQNEGMGRGIRKDTTKGFQKA